MDAVVGFKDACMDDAHPCIINLGTRGTDVEIEHDPNGKGSWNEGTDRWWICAYEGDINVTGDKNYPVPVGQCFIRFTHPDRSSEPGDHGYSIGLFPNYDDSPGAAATAISKKRATQRHRFLGRQHHDPDYGAAVAGLPRCAGLRVHHRR